MKKNKTLYITACTIILILLLVFFGKIIFGSGSSNKKDALPDKVPQSQTTKPADSSDQKNSSDSYSMPQGSHTKTTETVDKTKKDDSKTSQKTTNTANDKSNKVFSAKKTGDDKAESSSATMIQDTQRDIEQMSRDIDIAAGRSNKK